MSFAGNQSGVSASSGPPAGPARRPGQGLKIIAALLFMVFALPLLLIAGFLSWRQYRVLTTWPEVDAVVTKAELTTSMHRGSRPPVASYSARLAFRYPVGGRVYESTFDLGYASSTRSVIDHWLEQIPVGSHHRIRYDPSEPSSVSLASDLTRLSFAAPLMLAKWAGIILAVCVLLLLLGRWKAGRAALRQGG